ncbi:MAG: GFA family protein, partial [Chromatiales bacterium]
RRAHGAAFVTWLGYDEDSVAIANGDDTLRWYESSPGAERGFCVRCGSTIFFRSQRWPGELHITVANLDGDADRVPQAHVFWDSHVDWIDLGADLPRRDGGGA